MRENSAIEKKSLKIVQGNSANWKKLAKEAVCMANAYGGKLLIGIEDDSDLPPDGQMINEDLPHIVVRKIEQNTINVGLQPQIITAKNNAQYLELMVLRSASNIACTSDAKYYIRVSDECKPLLPDELGRLMVDKNAFNWETHVYQKVPYKNCDEQKLNDFRNQILRSLRVSDFIKQKSIEELLDYYFFKNGDYLTNLGVLWIGKRQHRANLRYAPVIQFIKYDVYGEKVNKLVWDDYEKNPQQLLEAVWNEIPDWKEHSEITDGLFKKQIANYSEKVVRELVVNALVHKPYTIRGDIFINLFPDKMEIHNPGLFPLGVTASNILHQSRRRNDNLAKVFYALNLMEREGRGYDEIYEDLLSNGKPIPIAEEGNDRVTITITKRIVSNEVVKLMDRASKEFQLKPKEVISLGIIAQNQTVIATELVKILGLKKPNALRDWLGSLDDYELIHTKGKTKGKEYFVNPEFLKKLDYKGKINLKNIEPLRLRELLIKVINDYGPCKMSGIRERIGKEIPVRKIRQQLDELIKESIVGKSGIKKGTEYFMHKNL